MWHKKSGANFLAMFFRLFFITKLDLRSNMPKMLNSCSEGGYYEVC